MSIPIFPPVKVQPDSLFIIIYSSTHPGQLSCCHRLQMVFWYHGIPVQAPCFDFEASNLYQLFHTTHHCQHPEQHQGCIAHESSCGSSSAFRLPQKIINPPVWRVIKWTSCMAQKGFLSSAAQRDFCQSWYKEFLLLRNRCRPFQKYSGMKRPWRASPCQATFSLRV